MSRRQVPDLVAAILVLQGCSMSEASHLSSAMPSIAETLRPSPSVVPSPMRAVSTTPMLPSVASPPVTRLDVQRRFEALAFEFMLFPSYPESPHYRAGYGEAIGISLFGPEQNIEGASLLGVVPYAASEEELRSITNYYWTLLSAALPGWEGSLEWFAQALSQLRHGEEVAVTVGDRRVMLRCAEGEYVAAIALAIGDSSEPTSTPRTPEKEPPYPEVFHDALGQRWSRFVGSWRPAPTATPTSTPDRRLGVGSTRVSPSDGMVMVYVPPGEFLMGAGPDEPNAFLWEGPQHAIFQGAYWIDRTEVTYQMFSRFLNVVGHLPGEDAGWFDANAEGLRLQYVDSAWSPSPGYGERPVALVSWFAADAYCAWAGRRLPTEAEWEKAARGTDGRRYPWGDLAPTCELATYSGCVYEPPGEMVMGTSPVGMHPQGASPYGALDMAGNVWEWISSQPFDYPYDPEDGREDTGPAAERALRGGGAFLDPAEHMRTSERLSSNPDSAASYIGFRCAVSP